MYLSSRFRGRSFICRIDQTLTFETQKSLGSLLLGKLNENLLIDMFQAINDPGALETRDPDNCISYGRSETLQTNGSLDFTIPVPYLLALH